MIEPLHVAVIGGHPLRFFRTPLNDGRPDLPWVAVDDLGLCLGLNRAERKIHRRLFRTLGTASAGATRTIETQAGPVSIIPMPIANATAAGLVEVLGKGSAYARAEYQLACGKATMKLGVGPFASVEAMTAWANAAATRWGSAGSPISAADLIPHMTVRTAEGEESRLINERDMLRLAMQTAATDDNKIEAVQNEIIEIVSAWHRGELLPRSEAPLLSKIYERSFEP